MAFRADQTKSHWEAIDVPVDNQQGQANPEKPGVMFALTPFLAQGILHAPLGFGTAVTNKMEVSILGRRQGVEHFLAPPFHQQMHIPIARLEQAAKAPGRDLGRGPTGEFFEGFVPRVERLHEYQPTQDEAVATFPETRHPTKEEVTNRGKYVMVIIADRAVQRV